PKEYGGAGLDVLSYAIAVEELSRVDGGTGVILSAHVSLGSWPIFAFGTEEQKRKYLTPLAKGEKIGAFGLTEPNAGSDAGGTETTAILKGDYYLLNGGKIFITNAPKADTYVVFAVTTPDIGTRGISAFIVEKGWEGFEFGDHYDKMGIRSSSTAELIFNDVKVPRENLLGKEGQGFKIAMATLDGGRIGIASQALGIAQGAFEHALEYSKERVQFGKPICQQQIVSFKLADMATKLRCARFLIYSAAELKEHHEPYGMEAAMAKQYASDISLEVTNDALQIFGGSGYLKGMEVERAYRDAKITTIYEGTNEIQRVVIASHLIGKMPREAGGPAKIMKKPAPVTGYRKKMILKEGSAQEVLLSLAEKGLVEEAGRLDVPGRPIAYRTTLHFLRCFGIESLEQLPPLPDQSGQVMLDEYIAGERGAAQAEGRAGESPAAPEDDQSGGSVSSADPGGQAE
ncbi:MAG: SMC-Scp complex subunit ScpB, partial [Clostridiales bacterium]|nr:SMC-Scp complex subunit ScpB [Clostridiales bacterium]